MDTPSGHARRRAWEQLLSESIGLTIGHRPVAQVAHGGVPSALREDPVASAIERSQDVEVPVIEGHDGSRPVTLGQDHV